MNTNITTQSKEVFISDIQQIIANRHEIINFVKNQFSQIIKQFDGKVCDIRLLKAIEAAASEAPKKITISMNYYTKGLFELTTVPYSVNPDHYFVIFVAIRSEKRVDYNDTIEQIKKWVEKQNEKNEELKLLLKNYDKYMVVANKLYEAAKSFNNLPYRFRKHIDKYLIKADTY